MAVRHEQDRCAFDEEPTDLTVEVEGTTRTVAPVNINGKIEGDGAPIQVGVDDCLVNLSVRVMAPIGGRISVVAHPAAQVVGLADVPRVVVARAVRDHKSKPVDGSACVQMRCERSAVVAYADLAALIPGESNGDRWLLVQAARWRQRRSIQTRHGRQGLHTSAVGSALGCAHGVIDPGRWVDRMAVEVCADRRSWVVSRTCTGSACGGLRYPSTPPIGHLRAQRALVLDGRQRAGLVATDVSVCRLLRGVGSQMQVNRESGAGDAPSQTAHPTLQRARPIGSRRQRRR